MQRRNQCWILATLTVNHIFRQDLRIYIDNLFRYIKNSQFLCNLRLQQISPLYSHRQNLKHGTRLNHTLSHAVTHQLVTLNRLTFHHATVRHVDIKGAFSLPPVKRVKSTGFPIEARSVTRVTRRENAPLITLQLYHRPVIVHCSVL